MGLSYLHFVQLARPYSFTSPVPGKEYAAWIVSNDTSITGDEFMSIARQLVGSGCRYAIASGHESSLWDEAVDYAYLETCNYEPRDEGFVMTAWEEEDSMEDIAHGFVWCTRFDEWEPKEWVIVAVGHGPDGPAAVEAATVVFTRADDE